MRKLAILTLAVFCIFTLINQTFAAGGSTGGGGGTITPKPTIQVLYPNGGEVLKSGKKTYKIRWETKGLSKDDLVLIDVRDTGNQITIPLGYHPNTGSYTWQVPFEYFIWGNMFALEGKHYRVEVHYISSNTNICWDMSDDTFTIVGDSPTTGVMSAKSTTLIAGEVAIVTIDAKDLDGLTGAYIYWSDGVQYNSETSWKYFSNNPTSKKTTFTFRLKQPGTYSFFGGVQGRRPDGVAMHVTATPNPLTIKVVDPVPLVTQQYTSVYCWSLSFEAKGGDIKILLAWAYNNTSFGIGSGNTTFPYKTPCSVNAGVITSGSGLVEVILDKGMMSERKIDIYMVDRDGSVSHLPPPPNKDLGGDPPGMPPQ